MDTPVDNNETNERNALRILILAVEQYMKGQDELGRTFIGPQAQAAVQILSVALDQRWAPAGDGSTPDTKE